MIALSRRAGVSEGDRRAMVGAAWSRAYALNRSADLVAWLPDLRRAFPELAADIRLVEAAKSAPRRRRLLTRLMLKAPGLVAIPTWARPPGGAEHFSVIDRKRPPAVTDFDFENANDGNCGAHPPIPRSGPLRLRSDGVGIERQTVGIRDRQLQPTGAK